MKFILTLTITLSTGRAGRVNTRRYEAQLKGMMQFYDSGYDEMRTWSYGGNCHASLDDERLTLSSPGLGAPVDQLDQTCKSYKDCQACARAQYGSNCVVELVKYDYLIQGDEVGHFSLSVLQIINCISF